MATKLVAARTAVAAGMRCGLLHGAYPERIRSFLAGRPEEGNAEGTYFEAMHVSQTMRDQRRWILSLPVNGDVFLDEGAVNAVQKKGNLLAVGVKDVKTTSGFLSGDCIRLLQEDGKEIARA